MAQLLTHNGKKRQGRVYYGDLMCIEFWPSHLLYDVIYWRRILGATGVQVPRLATRAEWGEFVADLDCRYHREAEQQYHGTQHTLTQLVYRSQTGFRLHTDMFRAYPVKEGGE